MQAECSHQSTAQLPAAQSRRLRPLCKKLDPDDRNAREQHSIFCRRLVASKNNGESNRCFGPIGRIRPESHSPCTISCFSSVAAFSIARNGVIHPNPSTLETSRSRARFCRLASYRFFV